MKNEIRGEVGNGDGEAILVLTSLHWTFLDSMVLYWRDLIPSGSDWSLAFEIYFKFTSQKSKIYSIFIIQYKENTQNKVREE